MDFLTIVDNIRKLLDLWKLSLSDLSVKSGITVNGLKHMFENGRFKFDSLVKIADSLNVPLIVLLADKISITEEISGRDYWYVTIRWTGGIIEGKKTIVRGNDALLNIIFDSIILTNGDQNKLAEEYKSLKRQNDSDVLEMVNLRIELSDKNNRIAFLNEQIEFYKFKAAELEKLTQEANKRTEDVFNSYEQLLKISEEQLKLFSNNPNKTAPGAP
jgi:hypothetical protein